MSEITEAVKSAIKAGEKDRKELIRIAKEKGASQRYACKIIRKYFGPIAVPKTAKPNGMKRGEFLNKFDDNTRTRNAIKTGLVTLAGETPEEDDILEDARFRLERCDNAVAAGFRSIAEEPEFAKYQFKVGSKVFWSTERTRNWALQNVSRARGV